MIIAMIQHRKLTFSNTLLEVPGNELFFEPFLIDRLLGSCIVFHGSFYGDEEFQNALRYLDSKSMADWIDFWFIFDFDKDQYGGSNGNDMWDDKFGMPNLKRLEYSMRHKRHDKLKVKKDFKEMFVKFASERKKRMRLYLASDDWIQDDVGNLVHTAQSRSLSCSYDDIYDRPIGDETLDLIKRNWATNVEQSRTEQSTEK